MKLSSARRRRGAAQRSTGGSSRGGRVRLAALALAALLGTAPATAGTALPAERQREVARAALDAFDAAVAVQRSEPARAAELYRQAQQGFLSLVHGGALNADLEFNLGNTEFRLGNVGRAVLHYRRALRLDPGHDAARANLAYVRGQVRPALASSAAARLLDPLGWQARVALRVRFWIAAGAGAAGWLGLMLWLPYRDRRLLVAGVSAAALGVLAGASAMWQLADETARPHAVVTSAEATLRLGRGEGYDPALRESLGQGVELRILQERAGWVEVRLGDGTRGWLPAETVERV